MKKIKGYFKDNSGYTLTEMIIVLAIILIMTAASFISLRVMHAAKAKEAASSFETELAAVVSDNKNKSVDYNMDDKITVSDKGYSIGLRLYCKSDKVYVQRCVIKDGNKVDLDETDDFIQSINVGGGKGTSMSAYVDVVYKDKGGNETKITGANEVYLAFNKKGECTHGVGTYDFYRKNGDRVARVVVSQNGTFH